MIDPNALGELKQNARDVLSISSFLSCLYVLFGLIFAGIHRGQGFFRMLLKWPLFVFGDPDS